MNCGQKQLTLLLCSFFMAAALGLFLLNAWKSLSVPLGLMGDHLRYQRAADFHRGAVGFPGWVEYECREEINKHPLYIITLSRIRRWGLDIPRLSLFLVLLSAAVVSLMVRNISGTSAGLLAGGLFLASPFVLSQTLVFASHGHLGLLFTLLAFWIAVSGRAHSVLFACLLGVFSAAAVLASFHSLLLVIPLMAVEVIFRLRRKRAALGAALAGVLMVILPLFFLHPQMNINLYGDKIRELVQDNVNSAQIFGRHYSLPLFLAFESENGVYSLTILFFLVISTLLALTRRKAKKTLHARTLLIVVTTAFILFEMLAVKLDRVYYPVWVAMIAFSTSGVIIFFQDIGRRDLRWVVPVLCFILMLGYWAPASQTIVSTCRAGIELFPTEESRRGVFIAGDGNARPLDLPLERDAVSRDDVKYLILRKYTLPPAPLSSFDNPDSRRLVIAARLYEELMRAEGIQHLQCWRTRPQFYYFSEDNYTYYRQGWWRPGPSLVVPAELYRKTRDAITQQLYPDL